jgi:hypothetical protein
MMHNLNVRGVFVDFGGRPGVNVYLSLSGQGANSVPHALRQGGCVAVDMGYSWARLKHIQ